MPLPQIAALIFAATTALVVGFQLALAFGAPWGSYAMGGVFPGRLPPAMRFAAGVQAVALTGLAILVLAAGGVAVPSLADAWRWLSWPPVVVSAIGALLNASTRSAGERRIWLPVTLVLLASSFVVAVQ